MIEKYLKWSLFYHLDAVGKTKPIFDYEIKVKNRLYVVSSLVNLYTMNDFDLTLTAINSYTAFEEFYYNQLPKMNKKIDNRFSEIKRCIAEIESSPENFTEPQTRLEKILRECKLTKEQFIEACVETGKSKNIKIVPYVFETITDLENMNCRFGINSGSPKLVIEEISRRKIGIESRNIAGSEFYFDKNDEFLRVWLNLGINKVKSMSYYFYPEVYCNFSLLSNPEKPTIVYTTDDLSPFEKYLVSKVGSVFGVTLFVGKFFEKNENEYVINAPELRKDFRNIKQYLNLIRRAKIRPFLIKPEESEEVIKLADEIKLSNYENLESLLDKIQEFVSLEIFFPSFTTKIEEKCKELKRKLEDKTLTKEEIREIVELMKSLDPAFHVSEERKKELREIISSSSR